MEFSDSNEEGRGGLELYRGGVPRSPEGGGATGPPAALVGRAHWSPEGGRQAPLSPVVGAIGPPFFFSRDFVVNLEKKNYTLGLSPYGRATGVYF